MLEKRRPLAWKSPPRLQFCSKCGSFPSWLQVIEDLVKQIQIQNFIKIQLMQIQSSKGWILPFLAAGARRFVPKLKDSVQYRRESGNQILCPWEKVEAWFCVNKIQSGNQILRQLNQKWHFLRAWCDTLTHLRTQKCQFQPQRGKCPFVWKQMARISAKQELVL